MNNNKIGIIFHESDNKIIASLSLDDLEQAPPNISELLKEASNTYLNSIKNIKDIVTQSNILRSKKKNIPAALMWDFGDEIFKLIQKLENNNFEFQDFYKNLIRDLNVSGTTLERVVSFRRYLTNKKDIPEGLNWGDLKGAPKKYLMKYL